MYGLSKSGLRKKKVPFNNGDNLVSMKNHDMTRHVTNRLHYFTNLQKQIDAHSTKAESIALRKAWLDKQKKINYTNEYDRIRSQIAQNVVKGLSTNLLEQRQQTLKNLGAQSLNGIH